MTLSAAAVAFFRKYVNGRYFREKAPEYGPFGHHGQDIPCSTHEQEYALRAGVVAIMGRSSVVGNYAAIKVAVGDYDGYCHWLAGTFPATGTVIAQSRPLGVAAGPADFHGSAWTGPHLHLTNGPTSVSVLGTDDVRDPAPIIRAQVAAFAGGGSTPIANGAEPVDQRTLRRDLDMDVLFCSDNNGPIWTVVDYANRVFAQTRDQKTANLWAILYCPGNTAKNITSSGNLGMLLANGSMVSQPWPFRHDQLPTSSTGSVDTAALAAALIPEIKDALSGVVDEKDLDTALASVVQKVVAAIPTGFTATK